MRRTILSRPPEVCMKIFFPFPVRRNTMPCSIPWARCPMRNFCNGNPDRKASPSMYRMHSEALGQILNATCKEEYESIKTAYQTDFIFNDKDSTDLSIYMPVLNVSKAITLTPEGFVCIAGERKNMKEFENYDGYKKRTFFTLSCPAGCNDRKWYKQGLRENEERKVHRTDWYARKPTGYPCKCV